MSLLIPYVHLYNHPEPLFEEITYSDIRARKLKNSFEKGVYVFFHTSIGGMKHVTAYYAVDCVLNTAEVIEDRNIFAKYKNPHTSGFLAGERTDKDDDFIIFGDPITSRIIKKCLIFDKTLAEKLSLNIKFSKGITETQTISSATRAWRKLTDRGVKVLLEVIKSSEKEGGGIETISSTDEITEFIEKDV